MCPPLTDYQRIVVPHRAYLRKHFEIRIREFIRYYHEIESQRVIAISNKGKISMSQPIRVNVGSFILFVEKDPVVSKASTLVKAGVKGD